VDTAESVATLWPDAPPMIGTQNAAVVRWWQAEACRLALGLALVDGAAISATDPYKRQAK
jgi:hypothetical protein